MKLWRSGTGSATWTVFSFNGSSTGPTGDSTVRGDAILAYIDCSVRSIQKALRRLCCSEKTVVDRFNVAVDKNVNKNTNGDGLAGKFVHNNIGN